jgi:non-structural maintenance of chromosomes element 4
MYRIKFIGIHVGMAGLLISEYIECMKSELSASCFIHFQLMKNVVPEGGELLPHRTSQSVACNEENDLADVEARAQRTPIRKLTRNRGLVLQDQVVQETPEEDQTSKRRRLFRNQD